MSIHRDSTCDLSSIELFSGCGGLAYGIAEAGFRHDTVIELDRNACATLSFNKNNRVRHYSGWGIANDDIRNIRFSEIHHPVTLVSGGPPCQPFSLGGKHKGPTDHRNMWPEAIRAVRELTPAAFIFENVRGLLRPAFSDYLDFIRLQLSWPEVTAPQDADWRSQLRLLKKHNETTDSPTYSVVVQAINAADYGAPQKRHRAIVLGIRSDIADTVLIPPTTHSREALIWSQRVTGVYWELHKIPKKRRSAITESDQYILDRLLAKGSEPKELPWVTVRDAIGDLPTPNTKETMANHVLHPGARAYYGHTGSSWDEPAKALKAGAHGVPGGENMINDYDNHVRYFTVREMIRLQGLPDEFTLNGSWMSAIKQLGNAVPVQVGKAFGTAIRKQLGYRKISSSRIPSNQYFTYGAPLA